LKVRRTSGKESSKVKGTTETEIQGQDLFKVPVVWTGKGLHEKVRHLPHMFQEFGAARAVTWGR